MGQDGKGKVMLESMIDIHLSNITFNQTIK